MKSQGKTQFLKNINININNNIKFFMCVPELKISKYHCELYKFQFDSIIFLPPGSPSLPWHPSEQKPFLTPYTLAPIWTEITQTSKLFN